MLTCRAGRIHGVHMMPACCLSVFGLFFPLQASSTFCFSFHKLCSHSLTHSLCLTHMLTLEMYLLAGLGVRKIPQDRGQNGHICELLVLNCYHFRKAYDFVFPEPILELTCKRCDLWHRADAQKHQTIKLNTQRVSIWQSPLWCPELF